MYSKAVSAAVLAAAASTVSAQTFTKCNPLEKTCPADPAFGNNKVDCDFSSGACSAFSLADGTTLKYEGNGAVFSIQQESNAPTIETGKYIFFGRLDVEVQAAAGNGIVTSCVLQSDDLDEIDWEWVGGDDAQAQSNYFSKGDTSTYDRGAYHPVSSPLSSFHTYSVEWTKDAVNWIIDGKTVRTLKAADAKGGEAFPQTPMQIKLGTWVAGGKNSPKGTADWAGGRTDFSQAPFVAYYKSVSIVDYAGGDGPTSKSVREYVYGDNTGSWESIVVKNGNGGSSGGNGGDEETTTAKTTTKVPQTTTAAETTTKVPETTTAPETTTKKTTMTTVSSVAQNTTTAGDATTTSDSGSGSETTGSAPSQVTQDDAAVRSLASFGSLAIAGAVVLAQLML